MENLSSILNKEQFLAVTHITGPSLILAGAGSGKTRVITYKVAYLIHKGVKPERILAITFTNKAANEMKERVKKLIGKLKNPPFISTFHSLGLFILKHEIKHLNYKDRFSIYDETDCQKILKDILLELKIPENEYNIWDLLYKISLLKMNLTDNILDKNIKNIYQKYNEYLKIHNAVDFDDLIKLPIEIFKSNPSILEKYQKKWEYILVDEYQDTSLMQYEFIKLIAQKSKNISVVGDDDQSIYSWRGANQNNFKLFEKDFAPVYEIKLEQNYRSTQTILDAANSIIKNNKIRKTKKLWTEEGKGEKISYFIAKDEEDEALFVKTMIIRLLNMGYQYKDIAILFRMNSLSRPFEEMCRESNFPYKMVGAMKFFDRAEIRDILSYMRFLANQDDEVALIRIINNPKRGIGPSTIQEILKFSKEHNNSMYRTIKHFIEYNTLGDKITPDLEDFVELIEKYKEMIFKPKNIAKTVEKLVEEIKYKDKLINEVKVLKKVAQRMNNINQLIQSISRYENNPDNFEPNLFEYLNIVSLTQRDDENEDKDNEISMMSIHSSKGLEFKVVFIVGVEEELLPHVKTIEETGSDEEERRLFYVALTRARERLFLSYPKKRKKFGEIIERNPSYFIEELPENLIEIIDFNNEKQETTSSIEMFLNRRN
ncbi:MAG TPA: exodeoxyribonuclease V subunit gamma [Spirochaetota bacterium]|nr:exodeoxyribonuclease V subunit gamma [Spirochaetota bacterium]HOL56124.1 exodeoxyribonuclease V subunit gamma [Spirochaetota bacterium]HPP04071.1 exodeoxyribonuclease V subunit gamma [Spirochaetota bacterium]